MRIYLIGMMGSGKTTVGEALNRYVTSKFIDLDAEIEKKCQMSIEQIFQQHGEDYFRQVETELLLKTKDANGVISTGGGVVISQENCDFLQNELTIFLKGSDNLLWRRVKDDDRRPLAMNEVDFTKRYQSRRPQYEAIAKYTIDIEDKTIKDIVAEILFIIAKEGA